MSKHDLQARPIYHHNRESIEAHLSDRVRRPGRQPLDRDTKPAGASRNSSAPPAATAPSTSKPDSQTLTAADPLPDDLRDALAKIRADGAH